MADLPDTVKDAVDLAAENDSKLNTMVALLVAMSATFMALCNVKDGNIVQAMAQAQSSSNNMWAYFQAKSTKQSLAEAAAAQLITQRELSPTMAPEQRAVLDRRIDEFKTEISRYEGEKRDIKAKAEAYAREYDELNVHDDQLDLAEAGFSISIALFGITALTKKRFMLFVALAFALFGAVFGVAGFLKAGLHPESLARLLS